VILTFCNVYLVRALKQSKLVRKTMQPDLRLSDDPTRIVTLTLAVIVVANLVLVAPIGVFLFVGELWELDMSSDRSKGVYNLVVAILQVLCAINFAFNFILYLAINAHFRRSVKEMFTCGHKGEDAISPGADGTTQQTSVPLMACLQVSTGVGEPYELASTSVGLLNH
jgi:hypothetical protein